MKSIFARHGIPEILISDNVPQFSSDVFTQFAKDFDFQHQTSSSNFPQSNGEIERAVKTVKALLEKASDPYVSLLSYRTTPLANGYSPTELLMSRKLQSTVPMITKQYIPKLPNRSLLQSKEQNYQDNQQQRFNTRHKTYELEPLWQGDTVLVPEFQKNGTVLSEVAPWSYMIQTPTGKVRRNRRHLTILTEINSTENGLSDTSTNSNGNGLSDTSSPLLDSLTDDPSDHTRPSPTTTGTMLPGTTVTRSGRISKRPDHLSL